MYLEFCSIGYVLIVEHALLTYQPIGNCLLQKSCLLCTFTFLTVAIPFHGFMMIYCVFQVLNADDNANMIELHSHLMKPEYSSSGQGKCSGT